MSESFAAAGGLVLTILLGLLSAEFLNATVRVELPERYKSLAALEQKGGGAYLGLLERVLFFIAFWLGQHLLAVGWLGFKVAARWATWAVLIRPPDAGQIDAFRDSVDLSARLLGRFLNGTLYNILCAAVGFVIGKFVFQ
ncbi:MAG TPA: hypothetical protein VNN77_00720 [candidate division Zixibacteria bacterium]|nr:hypothetical protein [candidate division Zixibacteria bacterium]